MVQINRKLLPIKAHFFFLFAAMGPIVPQFPVYGKELGISPIVMGTITGTLPFVFFVAKPVFGVLVDVYRNYRKCIFMGLIMTMTLFFSSAYFIPPKPLLKLYYQNNTSFQKCNISSQNELYCNAQVVPLVCNSSCLEKAFLANAIPKNTSQSVYEICSHSELMRNKEICEVTCLEDVDANSECLYQSFTFWIYVVSFFVGFVGFNVASSITDAICFDVIGTDGDYGKQRVWGTVGYGLAALISGYITNVFWENGSTTYAPMFILLILFSVLDIASCVKLKLPKIEPPKNVFKELKSVINNGSVVTFFTFASFVGILDSLPVFFLLWYLEDLAIATNTDNIKLIQGLTVAAETLGGEILFFSISGKILKRFGHVSCFGACFFFYGLRIGLISLAPSPWWIIPIEFCMNGPTFALGYSSVVGYANALAPPGASAIMQGIAVGMDDSVGFVIGSFLSGLLFKYVGAKRTFQIFSIFGFFCCAAHFLIHKVVLDSPKRSKSDAYNVEYASPEEALKTETKITKSVAK